MRLHVSYYPNKALLTHLQILKLPVRVGNHTDKNTNSTEKLTTYFKDV